MGTWAVDAFGNDEACDWAYDLEKVNDLSLIEASLDDVIACGSDYIETPEATRAIAAIEVIARLQGNWGERNAYSEPADDWVQTNKLNPSKNLAQKAHLAITRILGEDSELNELWQDSDDYADWLASIAELKARVMV